MMFRLLKFKLIKQKETKGDDKYKKQYFYSSIKVNTRSKINAKDSHTKKILVGYSSSHHLHIIYMTYLRHCYDSSGLGNLSELWQIFSWLSTTSVCICHPTLPFLPKIFHSTVSILNICTWYTRILKYMLIPVYLQYKSLSIL